MTQLPNGYDPNGDEDFDDIEWELSCSSREATVGLIPVPIREFPSVLPVFGHSHPWERRGYPG